MYLLKINLFGIVPFGYGAGSSTWIGHCRSLAGGAGERTFLPVGIVWPVCILLKCLDCSGNSIMQTSVTWCQCGLCQRWTAWCVVCNFECSLEFEVLLDFPFWSVSPLESHLNMLFSPTLEIPRAPAWYEIKWCFFSHFLLFYLFIIQVYFICLFYLVLIIFRLLWYGVLLCCMSHGNTWHR